jgi:ATP-binding cassette subfamily B multidrug efflux pump
MLRNPPGRAPMLFTLLRRSLGPYRTPILLVFGLLLLQSGANLYLPNLNADVINNGIAKGNIGYIWRTGAVMLGVTVLLGAVAIAAVYFASKVAMGAGRDIRGSLFHHAQRFSAREMNALGTASLITRNTNDVQQIQLFLQMALTFMVPAPIIAIGGVIMALREDVPLSAILLVVVPLMGVIISFILFQAVPLFQMMQVRIDRINQVLREQITGVRVIRAFDRVPSERERFEVANAELTETALRVNRIFALAMPSLMGVMNLSSVAVVWFGGRLVNGGEMPIGNLSAFLSYILQILGAVMTAVAIAILGPRAAASAVRIEEVLNAEPAIRDPGEPVRPASAAAGVEFRDVTFGYPGGERPVVEDINFTLRPGRTNGIIGGTGAGKTTLLNLITRSFDPTSGEVLVSGVDVRRQSLEGLWSLIGVVPQTAYLFSGTVAENLRYGRADATEAELWHALEIAQARDFVAAMPGGLDAVIEQGGRNVSGGQRQRLAIARALVKRPAIYLFDDAFSALDAATDARLRAALRAETSDATVLIVAQRVSTIMYADQIFVLEAGRIVGSGTHAELMATCAEYREIVESQLGEAAA